MTKTYVVDISFEAVANFATRVELNESQFKELKSILKKKNKSVYQGSVLHSAIFPVNHREFDYIEPDAEMEEVEYKIIETKEK